MNLLHRAFEVKALPDQGEGVFSGYASTYDRDLYDDVIVKGAFAECLQRDFKGTGEGIPIYWNHDYSTPMNLIGASTSAVEDDKGLFFTGRLDLDSPEGARAYEHLKAGRVHQMSIGFICQETAYVKSEGDRYAHRELRKVKLFEVSLVTVAANQQAEVDEVKAAIAEAKAGRAISAANEEKIRAAYEALGEILESIADVGDDGDGSDDADDADGAQKSATSAERAAEFKKIAEFIGGATTSEKED